MTSHLVASVRLLDGSLALGALFGLVPHVHVGQVIFRQVFQVLVAIPLFKLGLSTGIPVQILFQQVDFFLGVDAATNNGKLNEIGLVNAICKGDCVCTNLHGVCP